MLDQVRAAFLRNGWFDQPGAYVLVDGQFGSTGKGAIAALMGATLGDQMDVVTTNAGPNSGHTGYATWSKDPMETIEGGDWRFNAETGQVEMKIVTRQIPVASVVIKALGLNPNLVTYLNAGAIIDEKVLKEEVDLYQVGVVVHRCAAFISDVDRQTEQSGSIAKVASTGKGVGAALARKVLRDPNAILGNFPKVDGWPWHWETEKVFVETAQGFSLGLNEARFYPFVTSRECTVMQAISDARIPAQMVKKVIMTVRTHPIRVGNTEQGQSGGCYPDQKEIQWSDIGVQPELTTVTQRVRRVFTWSRIQFREALAANRPDVVALMFCDYLQPAGISMGRFMNDLVKDYVDTLGRSPDFILTGWGPRPEDVRVL